MKYLLFPHGGSANHGCEAIVRTTKALLTGEETILYSHAPQEDRTYLGRDFVEIQAPQQTISRRSMDYAKAAFAYHAAGRKDAFDALSFAPVISQCGKDSVLLSIGGDNYCYGENEHIYTVNRHVRRKGTRTVLWGCSVEPDALSGKMAEDLRVYDLIVARESLTYEALVKINSRTVLWPDPAFALERQEAAIPTGLTDRAVIGINVSPLIQGYEPYPGMVMENYAGLVEGILEATDAHIALVPHVVQEGNDDRVLLERLQASYAHSGRVFCVEDQNCMQLKDAIARCSFFVGARTHATIAAYSACVPTLVVGYSVKARGIARDLFGTEEGYVLPVQQLQRREDLWQAFTRLWARQTEIKEHLATVMPDYVERAKNMGALLRDSEI